MVTFRATATAPEMYDVRPKIGYVLLHISNLWKKQWDTAATCSNHRGPYNANFRGGRATSRVRLAQQAWLPQCAEPAQQTRPAHELTAAVRSPEKKLASRTVILKIATSPFLRFFLSSYRRWKSFWPIDAPGMVVLDGTFLLFFRGTRILHQEGSRFPGAYESFHPNFPKKILKVLITVI